MTRYVETHEWVRLDSDDDIVAVGISEYAVGQLGDVVFVELPKIGQKVKATEEIAVIESVKAASDIYAPISGEIVLVNSDLLEQPELVNKSPEAKGWLLKIQADNTSDLDVLLNKEAYDALCVG